MRKRAPISAEVVIIGGGLAGLSAAIYLGRAKCDALLIDDGKSMARWEPDVQNYLGFPAGIAGEKLLRAGREQARRYGIRFCRDRIRSETAERAGSNCAVNIFCIDAENCCWPPVSFICLRRFRTSARVLATAFSSAKTVMVIAFKENPLRFTVGTTKPWNMRWGCCVTPSPSRS